ncbi:hypothetical protein O181_014823 [Austropuccinia psidii MF-1]|uniref:Conserved oligomeric Golgi complex subunit 3 n=1 Tax=Austropuccinia psidii MF-1 TaxID=1389203 RepID=A0A9Q3C1Z3_9BASI|nr:hypothetical protein [Austropuccinia psidii MF-1]
MSHWEFNQSHKQSIPSATLTSSPNSKLNISQQIIENWDQLSPLTELERQSIHSIQKALTDKPLPSSLISKSNNSNQSIISSTNTTLPSLLKFTQPNDPYQINLPDQSNVTNIILDQGQKIELLNHHVPISTIENFNDWFTTISSQIESESESDYLNHSSIISTYLKSCDSLDQAIDHCNGLLHEIQANWKFVDENSKSLERSCEGMLDDQKVLRLIASGLDERLSYFRRLDEAQRILSMPGEAEIVKSNEFLPMVERLDLCLEFMRTNRHFRDADLYLVRFQQCLIRAMTLIKLHYTNLIRSLGYQVQEKLQGKEDLSSNLIQTLLYDKFEILSTELKPLIEELEKRYGLEPEQYESLINEFFSTWFTVRRQLLSPRLKAEINLMDISHSQVPNLIKLFRNGSTHLRMLCLAEWKLFKLFFAISGDEELFAFLESLCDYLYDLLRPQILHEHRLEILCDLATITNALIAMDTSLLDESDSQDFKFSSLLKPILQDVQTRMIFRAQAIIQTDVARYQPKKQDLEYPTKLLNYRQSVKAGNSFELRSHLKDNSETAEPANTALRLRLPSEEVQETWYPTLRKTLWVLSKLHTYVNDAIFEDFAGEAVGICSQSIVSAAALINPVSNQSSSSSTSTNAVDHQLFIIRHLLILKEMIRTLDILQVDRAVDLGPITDVLKDLLNPSTTGLLLFRPTDLIQRLSNRAIRDFSQKTIDSKSELDKRLKLTCQEFIAQTARAIGANTIESFMMRCQDFLNLVGGSITNRDLPSQEWATKEIVKEVEKNYSNQLQVGLRAILNKMILYLEDEKTVNVIFPPLKEEILERYQQFYNFIKSEYDPITINELQNLNQVDKLIEKIIYEQLNTT